MVHRVFTALWFFLTSILWVPKKDIHWDGLKYGRFSPGSSILAFYHWVFHRVGFYRITETGVYINVSVVVEESNQGNDLTTKTN